MSTPKINAPEKKNFSSKAGRSDKEIMALAKDAIAEITSKAGLKISSMYQALNFDYKKTEKNASTGEEKIKNINFSNDTKQYMQQELLVAQFVKDHGHKLGLKPSEINKFAEKHGIIDDRSSRGYFVTNFNQEFDKLLVNAVPQLKAAYKFITNKNPDEVIKAPKIVDGAETYMDIVEAAVKAGIRDIKKTNFLAK